MQTNRYKQTDTNTQIQTNLLWTKPWKKK